VDGEEVLAAVIAAPRGYAQQAAGSTHVGSARRGRAHGAAKKLELRLKAPMAIALTQRRLITLKIGTPTGLGIEAKVTQLMSAVAIGDVDSIVAKHVARNYTITLTVGGIEIGLESNAASVARRFGAAFERTRTAGA
jgi:hypothetical protein